MRRVIKQDYKERVLGHILREQAEEIPDRPFLTFDDDSYTFGRFNSLVNRYAGALRSCGVERGDCITIMMDNCPEFALLSFAAAKLGACNIPISVDYRGDWLRGALEHSAEGKILAISGRYAERLLEVGAGELFKQIWVRRDDPSTDLAALEAMDISEAETHPGAEPNSEVDYRDLLWVNWTSGTTGPPKGALLTHHYWFKAIDYMNDVRDVREGDSFYVMTPMHHAGAWLMGIYPALISGLHTGVDQAFSATGFWDRVRHYDATQIMTLGAMVMFLWNLSARSDDAENPARVAGLIPIPHEILEPFKERFGIEYVWQGSGQTECMPWSMADKRRSTWKPGSAGWPNPNLEVKLLDDDDREVPVGEVGEFCIRPKEPFVIFSGYFKQPGFTLDAFRNLWYHSGDLGRKDADGEFFFVDRKADFIRYKGRNVSCFDVEAVLRAHPLIADVAVHGVPSDELSSEDEIKSCVVLRDGGELAPEDLARYVNDNAPHFMVPRYIEFLPELPKTPTGRVQKYKLRETALSPSCWDRVTSGFEVRR